MLSWTAAVKEDCGLPWAVACQPYAQLHDGLSKEQAEMATDARSNVPLSTVARCEKCFAYINPFCRRVYRWYAAVGVVVTRGVCVLKTLTCACVHTAHSWVCPICRNRNLIVTAGDGQRYTGPEGRLHRLVEMRAALAEFEDDRALALTYVCCCACCLLGWLAGLTDMRLLSCTSTCIEAGTKVVHHGGTDGSTSGSDGGDGDGSGPKIVQMACVDTTASEATLHCMKAALRAAVVAASDAVFFGTSVGHARTCTMRL